MRSLESTRLGIIGLGYVGLPLAVEFGKHYPTVGFDIKAARIEELKAGNDSTLETTSEDLASAELLTFSTDKSELAQCNTFIVTVPTPVGKNNRPLLTPLKGASETVGHVLKKGDVVVYESTVYPGCTEEYCVPILESRSGLKFNRDFFAGYSPERINPGRQGTPAAIDQEDHVRIDAGDRGVRRCSVRKDHHRGYSQGGEPKVAEAAKVIENTQRDINIALINELSMIFNRLGIDTEEVLKAAGTQMEFPATSSPGSSAGIASASIPIT